MMIFISRHTTICSFYMLIVTVVRLPSCAPPSLTLLPESQAALAGPQEAPAPGPARAALSGDLPPVCHPPLRRRIGLVARSLRLVHRLRFACKLGCNAYVTALRRTPSYVVYARMPIFAHVSSHHPGCLISSSWMTHPSSGCDSGSQDVRCPQ